MDYSKPYQITSSDKHHFFGYYAISPWSKNGRYFVCLESSFQNHMPKFGETAKIILIDYKTNSNIVLTETHAWNFQQGAMLHWLPSEPNSKIIFNDTDGEKVFSRIIDIITKEERILPLPVNAIGRTRDIALSLNYSRLRRNRKVVSYPCSIDDKPGKHPSDDGVYLMDLKTGNYKLVANYDQIWNLNPKTRNMNKIKQFRRELWFNHLSFNHDDTRFFFLARYRNFNKTLATSMWTININGTDPYILVNFGHKLSHFEWINNEEIIITMRLEKRGKMHHYRVKDKTQSFSPITPEFLVHDGHPAIHPSKQYFATDTYVIKGKRYVYLVNIEEKPEKVQKIAEFTNPKLLIGNLRCDPHPRWNNDGTKLSYDGLGPNGRQIYVIDFKK